MIASWVANAFYCSRTLASLTGAMNRKRLNTEPCIKMASGLPEVPHWPHKLPKPPALCSWDSLTCRALGNEFSPRHEAMGGHSQVQRSLLPSHFLSSNTQAQASLLFGIRKSSSPKNRRVTLLSLTQIHWTLFFSLNGCGALKYQWESRGKENTPQISILVLWDDPPHGDGVCENY